MMSSYPQKLFLLCALVLPGAAHAEMLVCSSVDAWRLEAAGIVKHPSDFYGLPATSDLRADVDAATFGFGSTPIPGMRLRSIPDAATGADLVFSTDDGSMNFRARMLDDAIPFMLMDIYDIYIGTCQR